MSALSGILPYLIATTEIPATPKTPDPTIWRPPQWNRPVLTLLTVPGTGSQPTSYYVFDAVLQVQHQQELHITEFPVQTGANISDHAFRRQPRVTLEIGMSDAMASYRAGMWTGNRSKSVSAYQTLLAIQQSRSFCVLNTRIDYYQSLLLESISVTDSNETRYGLRATAVFKQIITASATAGQPQIADSQLGYISGPISPGLGDIDATNSRVVSYGTPGAVTADNSDRPQATNSTPMGTVQATPVPQQITKTYQVGTDTISVPPYNGPAAGTFSSTTVASSQ